MTHERAALVDPNAADLDTLCLLPGVGPVLAQRIVAARPFETAQDLTRVRGISSNTVERWLPRLAMSPAPIQPPAPGPDLGPDDDVTAEVEHVEARVVPAEPAVEAKGDMTETAPAPDTEDRSPEPPEAVPEATPEPRRAAVTRGYAGCLVAASGLVVLVLSIVLSLGILAALNHNQLQFASPGQVSALAVRVESLETKTARLGQDVEGLRTRLSNLEAMGERMSAVELAAEGLQTDVDALTTEAADLSAQIGAIEEDLSTASQHLDDLQTEVGTLQTQAGRFQTFLEGLQALVDALFQPEGGQ